MKLESFEFITKSENRARLFFKKACWENDSIFCTRCRSLKVYRIIGKRYRCKRCKYTFHDFSNRWINQLRIAYEKWLCIIKFFEVELSTRKISQQVGLSYPTVLKAVTILRMALLASQGEEGFFKGEIELDETYFGGRRKGKRGRRAAGKVPVFGVYERNGTVRVEVVKSVTAESLLNMTIKKVRRGSIVYTDKFQSYDALMFCGYRHLRVDHKRRFFSGKVYINGLEGFWSYAKEMIIKFHGVSKEKFPLYLKEMEFRYNNRHNNLFNLIVQKLCNLVPHLL